MTNAGGPGIACADACAAAGLRVEPLAEPVRRAPAPPPARPCRGRQPGRHDRLGLAGGLPAHDRARRRRPRRRRRDRDLHPAARHARRRRRRRDPRRERGDRGGRHAAARRVHGRHRRRARGAGRRRRGARLRDARGGGRARSGTSPATPRWRREGPDEPPALADVDADAVAAVLARALARRRRLARARRTSRPSSRAYGIPLVESRVRGRPRRRPGAARPSSAGRWRSRRSRPASCTRPTPAVSRSALQRPDRRRRAPRARWRAPCAPPVTSPRASSSSGWRRRAPS